MLHIEARLVGVASPTHTTSRVALFVVTHSYMRAMNHCARDMTD